MRLSLWQQFSSNHSASFMIIGTFQTVEQAQAAASNIRHILRSVAAYWQGVELDQREQVWRWAMNGDSTPVERALSQQYGIEWSKNLEMGWPSGIDWLPADPDKAEKAIRLHGKSIFMENIGDTYVGSEPFESLLRQFGAQVVGWRERGSTYVNLRLTCDAPTEQVAQSILDQVIPEYIAGDPVPVSRKIPGVLDVDGDSHLTREGRQLSFTVVNFGISIAESIADLSGFIAYLTAQGCTSIAYTFEEVRD